MGLTNGVVEIADNIESTPQNIEGVVAIAGTPISITSAGGNIQLALIKNPGKGPNANASNVVLRINIDGSGTPKYVSLARGEFLYLPGIFATLKIDSTVNGGKYEVVIWG